jgi:broad specificity phosphatase PhoE
MTMGEPTVYYWVRHGENLANVAGQFSHRKLDHELTEKGRAQARQAAEFLAGQRIGDGPVYVSPLKRAIMTGQIIGERLQRPLVVIEELREIDVGALEGRSDAEAIDLFWQVVQSWREGDRGRRFPEGEDHHAMTGRIQRALERIRSAGPGPHVVVAHAGLLRAGFTHLLDKPFAMRIAIPNCSVSRLEIDVNGAHRFTYVAQGDCVTEPPAKGSA